jgi:hypothetical protein
MWTASLGGFDRLTVDNRRTGRRLASVLYAQALPQRPHHPFPDTGVAPLAKVVLHCRPGRVIMGKPPPGPSTTQHIKDPIEDLPHLYASGSPSWFGRGNEWFEDGPFGIRKVTRIGFHQGVPPHFPPLFPLSTSLVYNIFSAWHIPPTGSRSLFVQPLVLRSLNTITKEAPMTTRCLRWAPPDPGLGPQVKLRCCDASGLFDFLRIGKALASKRITAEEAPPALLQVEPACPCRNKDVMEARMLFQPGTRLETVLTGEIIADDEDITRGIVGFNVGEQSDVALGVARSRAASEFLAIAYPERPIDPGLLGSPPIVHRRFDAVTVRRPAWGGIKGARDYRSEFIGTDGSLSLGWLRVVGDDRRSFGTKSLSRGVLQLCVCRQRTPSRSRMVRI